MQLPRLRGRPSRTPPERLQPLSSSPFATDRERRRRLPVRTGRLNALRFAATYTAFSAAAGVRGTAMRPVAALVRSSHARAESPKAQALSLWRPQDQARPQPPPTAGGWSPPQRLNRGGRAVCRALGGGAACWHVAPASGSSCRRPAPYAATAGAPARFTQNSERTGQTLAEAGAGVIGDCR